MEFIPGSEGSPGGHLRQGAGLVESGLVLMGTDVVLVTGNRS